MHPALVRRLRPLLMQEFISHQSRHLHVELSRVVIKDESVPSGRPPLILLHGLCGSKQNWRSLAKAMARAGKLTVVAVDARNHGDSPHDDVMTYEAMANDVSRLIVDLGYEKADVLGHSMGGKSAMVLGLRQKEFVRKLIIEDVAPSKSPGDLDFRRYIAAMKEIRFDGIPTLAEARKIAGEQLQHAIPALPVRAFLLQNIVKGSNGSFRWQVNIGAIEANLDCLFDFPSSDRSYDGEVLFIRGSASGYLRNDNGLHSEIKKLFTRAKFCTIPEAGHWVHSERPHEFRQVVLDYLAA